VGSKVNGRAASPSVQELQVSHCYSMQMMAHSNGPTAVRAAELRPVTTTSVGPTTGTVRSQPMVAQPARIIGPNGIPVPSA
ncbi:unnamed protein product, partial [Polarella glacialis]